MPNERSVRLWGCGAGAGCGCGCFVLGTALAMLISYLAFEYGGVRNEWNHAPAVFVWTPLIGLVLGLLVGAVMTFAGRAWAARRGAGRLDG